MGVPGCVRTINCYFICRFNIYSEKGKANFY